MYFFSHTISQESKVEVKLKVQTTKQKAKSEKAKSQKKQRRRAGGTITNVEVSKRASQGHLSNLIYLLLMTTADMLELHLPQLHKVSGWLLMLQVDDVCLRHLLLLQASVLSIILAATADSDSIDRS